MIGVTGVRYDLGSRDGYACRDRCHPVFRNRTHRSVVETLDSPAVLGIVGIENRGDGNLVPGQAHRIKTADKLYGVVVGSVPDARFGLAFSLASGDLLERISLFGRFGYRRW
jgi:hypothetical protein